MASAKAPCPLDVMVIGEALIDVVTTVEGKTEHPGGSPMNVAYGLGRLGVSTGLLTAIGVDARGASIESHLRSAGVAMMPGSKSLDRTAAATATLHTDGSAQYDFDVIWDLPLVPPADIPKLLHTGSIATFLAPGAAAVRTLLEQAHGHCIITYDPNIRPALLGSHAQAVAMFEELVPLTDVVKLSDEDAHWLYPGLTLEGATDRLLELGTALAVVTRGSEGSLLAANDSTVHVPAVTSVVVDTIGAGDSYMAALIRGLIHRGKGDLVPGALERLGWTAAMAASITVGRSGANPPTAKELGAALERQPIPVWGCCGADSTC